MPIRTLNDEPQHTLAAPATVTGRGLFSGGPATLTLRPEAPGRGIRFRRTDLPAQPDIPALIDRLTHRPRRTALQEGDASVETVEHVLSALAGLGVDNALIELDAPEVPAGDGSAQPFTDAIQRAGVQEQDAPRSAFIVDEPIMLREGDAMISALPSEAAGTEILYALDFGPRSPIPRQVHSFTVAPTAYLEQIAPARTFSTREEAEALWQRGMFKHLSPREMLVVGDAGPIDNAYRFEGEPVRHKVLDLLGDLSLVGVPVRGRIVAVRSGHALNHRLAREVFSLIHPDGLPPAPAAPAMDIRAIMRMLPHRYPMILVDRVLEMDADRRAVGVKNVSINEPFFQGHYPTTPIMPGVLIIEAMSQLAGLMLSRKLERTGKIAVLLTLDEVKLRRPVVPGDQLVMEAESLRSTTRMGDVQCRAFVAGELAAEARIKFMMVDAEQQR
ncbi:MAG TPA: 3-hydroxyacyl-[acyl-carrier-protein] dehydratase FabZ [Phycisphaerales bacterium]|nr:3-hydroxyacyl-[acyl-carrier-protein] dehydratase FabZ [Phycisphaerales bacterium]